MQYATCNLQHATCTMQQATSNPQQATKNLFPIVAGFNFFICKFATGFLKVNEHTKYFVR
jgi:hypothetical protein